MWVYYKTTDHHQATNHHSLIRQLSFHWPTNKQSTTHRPLYNWTTNHWPPSHWPSINQALTIHSLTYWLTEQLSDAVNYFILYKWWYEILYDIFSLDFKLAITISKSCRSILFFWLTDASAVFSYFTWNFQTVLMSTQNN